MECIRVQKRDFTLKAKKLRRNGMIPGSVFGKSLPEAISLQIDEVAARKLLTTKREGSRLNLDLDGQIIPVQIKEKNVNIINNEIIEISFQALKADEKANSVLYIVLKNTDKITDSVETQLLEIPYAAYPKDMIDTITIDVDGKPLGTTVTVGDIPELVNDKIDLQVDKDEIVYRIVEKKRVEAEDEEEETEETEPAAI